MDDYEQANTIMLMLIFWRAGPVILELNLTGLFILHVSHRGTRHRRGEHCQIHVCLSRSVSVCVRTTLAGQVNRCIIIVYATDYFFRMC